MAERGIFISRDTYPFFEEFHEDMAQMLLDQEYTAFSNLATLSLNSRARSAAIFVSLVRNGLIEEVKDYDSYLHLFRTTKEGHATGPESYENVQLLDSRGPFSFFRRLSRVLSPNQKPNVITGRYVLI